MLLCAKVAAVVLASAALFKGQSARLPPGAFVVRSPSRRRPFPGRDLRKSGLRSDANESQRAWQRLLPSARERNGGLNGSLAGALEAIRGA